MYKENDEVIILDASKISQAESKGFKTGEIYIVESVFSGNPCLLHNLTDERLYFFEKELKYIKKVEKVMYKKGDKLLRTGGSNQFYKQGKTYEVLHVTQDRVTLTNEKGKGSSKLDDVNKFFELVSDDSVDPYNPGEEIVFTDISNVGGASRGILTVGKVYEVLKWDEADNDRNRVEHFVVKGNDGKEFIVRYDEFKYVKKLIELERKTYIRTSHSNSIFKKGEKYEAVVVGDRIIFDIYERNGRSKIYLKSNIDAFFKEATENVENHNVKIGDRFLRTGSSGSMFKRGCIYSVYRVDIEGAWLVGDNGQQGFYVFSMLNNPEYFVSVGEAERLREELEIKDKQIESKDKEIAALKATIRILQPIPVVDVNEERKIVIHRSKEFISEYLNDETQKHYDYDMFYTKSRRMVTVLIKYPGTNKIYLKGQSICTKGDVFNLYIGRAIALGRALGIDVSYFENAVQPELAIGQTIKLQYHVDGRWHKRLVIDTLGEYESCEINENTIGYVKNNCYRYKIISDTDARYSIKPL